MKLIFVMVGGAAGSAARYLTVLAIGERVGTGFPWGTLTVNVVGSLLIGMIATLADERRVLGDQTRLLLVTGVLGGFTTFSAFSLEVLRLGSGSGPARTITYVVLSIGLSLPAAWLGVVLCRALVKG